MLTKQQINQYFSITFFSLIILERKAQGPPLHCEPQKKTFFELGEAALTLYTVRFVVVKMLITGRCEVRFQVGGRQRMTIHGGQTTVAGYVVVVHRAALEIGGQQTGLQASFTCYGLNLLLLEIAHLVANHLFETPRFRAALLLETCVFVGLVD